MDITDDKAALNDMARIEQEIKIYGFPTTAQIDRLLALREKYPLNDHLIGLLDKSFRAMRDNQRLYELHASLPPQKHTKYHRFFLGHLLNQLEQYEDAAAILVPMTQTDPHNPDVAMRAAVALSYLRRYDEARVLLARFNGELEKREPRTAALIWGAICDDAGELEKALAWYTFGLKTKPERSDLHSQMARVLHRMGRPDEADHHAKKAIELTTAQAAMLRWNMHLTRTLEAWRSGEYAKMIDSVDVLITLADDPVSASACYLIRERAHTAMKDAAQAAQDRELATAWREKARVESSRELPPKAQAALKTVELVMRRPLAGEER